MVERHQNKDTKKGKEQHNIQTHKHKHIPGGHINGLPSNIILFIAFNLENDNGICCKLLFGNHNWINVVCKEKLLKLLAITKNTTKKNSRKKEERVYPWNKLNYM